jgi:hypothetical protein
MSINHGCFDIFVPKQIPEPFGYHNHLRVNESQKNDGMYGSQPSLICLFLGSPVLLLSGGDAAIRSCRQGPDIE